MILGRIGPVRGRADRRCAGAPRRPLSESDLLRRERELAAGQARTTRLCSYASRFAAKEACAKALGTGITDRVRWQHIEVLIDTSGLPMLNLTEGAQRRAKRLAGGRGVRAHYRSAHDGWLELCRSSSWRLDKPLAFHRGGRATHDVLEQSEARSKPAPGYRPSRPAHGGLTMP